MYSKDGESYFIVDGHIHAGMRAGQPGQQVTARASSTASTTTTATSRPAD